MNRVLALVLKDLRQHLGAVIGIGLLGALSVFFSAVVAASSQMSAFEAHARFTLVFLPLAALVLGNRLVVAEYHGRTQLFLEALPVRRWEMVATKFLFGLASLLLLAVASMGLSALIAAARETVDATFVLRVGARTAAFAFCVWSVFFAMGFTGKWRIPIYLGLFIALTVIFERTDLELDQFGPFELVDPSTLPFERTSFPTGALLESLAFGAGWLALGVGLALANEGSVAESLARRMTQREKAAVTALFVGAVIATTALDERREKEPFDFGQSTVLRGARAEVQVLYLEEERREEAQWLLKVLEADLAELSALLGRSLPATRIAFHSTLDGRTFERAELRKNDGVLVRANFERDSGFDQQGFRAYLVREVLAAATRDRARFEPRAFALDGFSRWWSGRDGLSEAERHRLRLRARWAVRDGVPEAEEVRRWWPVRERLGEPVAEALAWSALDLLEERQGREAVERLAQRLYGRESSDDFSESWRESPFESDFEAATSMKWEALLGQWRERLAKLRADPGLAAELGPVAGARGALEVARGAGSLREVRYRFELDAPLPAERLCSLLHLEVGPFDAPIESRALLRDEHRWTEGSRSESHVLSGRYGAGERVFFALECESQALGCPVRLLAQRRELP